MFNFIKWELRDFFKRKIKIGIFFAVIILLALLAPSPIGNSDAGMLIWIPFYFLIMYLVFAMFIEGTRVIINTYRNKTFLLESMVSYSPAKLLLTKYLIAIMLNIMYAVLLFISACVFVYKIGDVNLVQELYNVLNNISVINMLKLVIMLFVSSIQFTSLIVMVYIISKCINPSKKGTVIIGIIIWWFINYFQTKIISAIVGTNTGVEATATRNLGIYMDASKFFSVIGIYLIFIVIYYFISVKLIKDKLEIYS